MARGDGNEGKYGMVEWKKMSDGRRKGAEVKQHEGQEVRKIEREKKNTYTTGYMKYCKKEMDVCSVN